MPKRKTLDEVKREIFEIVGNEYTLIGEYLNNHTPISIRHNVCGHYWNPTIKNFIKNNVRCPKCGKTPKHTYAEVKHFIEVESNTNSKLLSTSYVNSSELLSIECSFGHKYTKRFNDFKRGSHCPNCSNELKSINQRFDFEYVKNYIDFFGYTLKSNVYKNNKSYLLILCDKGHYFRMTFGCFKNSQQRCPQCHLEQIKANATSALFLYLRAYMTDWKEESMKKCDYKCVITGGKFDAIHHLYSFNKIAKETVEKLNMPLHPNISLYTDNELKFMIDTCADLHEKYGLGVCLREDVHRLFHSEYGNDNSPDQFEEFRVNYLNGVFHSKVS